MLTKRLICIISILVLTLSFTSCKSEQNGATSSTLITNNGDMVQVDITPADPDDVASAAADYKPDKGYKYEKSDNTTATDGVDADGYILSTKDDEGKSLACVYFEQSDVNCMEIDIMTKGMSDADLDAAVKMVRKMIQSTFKNFPLDELSTKLPLTTVRIKGLISNNVEESNIVYGMDTDISIEYHFDPKGGTLIFRIEI